MASDVDGAQDSVILASFENRHAAEHMLASLRRGFRKKHRKGHATALVISGNKDGSLKLTQSRVLTASGFVYTLIRIPLSVTIGFTGMLSTLEGAKGAGHEVHLREAHVGSDEHVAHAILAQVGPDAAVALVCCDDQKHGMRSPRERPTVQATAGMDRGRSSSPPSTPAARTTGCVPLSMSPQREPLGIDRALASAKPSLWE